MLNRLAREFAAEIYNHDWSDAPYRLDRAGHDRASDRTTSPQLTTAETDSLRTNVMWVAAQVLKHADPNLDEHEFAEACGVPRSLTHTRRGHQSGVITAGIRTRGGRVCKPGSWDVDRLLTVVDVDATNDPLRVTFEWAGGVRRSKSVLWVVWVSRADGGDARQLGYKIVDGQFSAHYVFDFATAQQQNLTDYAARLSEQSLVVEFPMSAVAGLGDDWRWRAVLNIDGDDVDEHVSQR